MATKKDRIAAWLVDNQDKAGTPEFETMALAYRVEQAGGVDNYAQQKVGPRERQPKPSINGTPLASLAMRAGENLAESGVGEQLAGYGRDILSGVTALPRGLMQIGAGAVGDVGRAFGSETIEDAGYGAKARLMEDEQYRRDNTSSAPMRMMGEVMAGGPIGRTAQGVKQLAVLGAGLGTATAATSDSSRALQAALGGAAGGALPAIAKGGQVGAKTVRNLVDPMLPGGTERQAGRALRDAAGSKKQAIIDALRKNRQLPGGKSGAGEVAAPAGSAEFSALQRISERVDPSDYAAMASADDAARARMLSRVSGSASKRAGANALRSNNAATNYQRAYSQPFAPDNELNAIMKDPYIKRAKSDLETLVKSKDVKTDSVEYLHLVKKRLEDMIRDPQTSGISNTESGQVKQVMSRLLGWMDDNVPEYAAARSQYADDSVPINQMEVGKFLRDKLVAPIDDVSQEITSKQRPSSFAQAVRDAPQTIKRSTGDARYNDLSEVLSGDQMKSVRTVAKSLARRGQYESIAPKGMARAGEIVEAPNLPATGPLNQNYMIFKTAVNRLSGKVQGETLEVLAQIMKDPNRAADLLEQVPVADQAIVRQALQDARTAAIVGAYQGVD